MSTMNSKELAREIGDITPDELCRLAREKKIPARKRKGLWRFNEESVAALRKRLAQRRR